MAWSEALRAQFVAEFGSEFYHVTDAKNIAAILRDGLRPNMPSQFDGSLIRPGVVYLCQREDVVGSINEYFDIPWGDAALSVSLLDLDVSRFVGDEDYYRGMDDLLDHYTAAEIVARRPEIDAPEEVDRILRRGRTAYFGAIPGNLWRVAYIDPHRSSTQPTPLSSRIQYLTKRKAREAVPGLEAIEGPRDWPEIRCRTDKCPLHPKYRRGRHYGLGPQGRAAVEAVDILSLGPTPTVGVADS